MMTMIMMSTKNHVFKTISTDVCDFMKILMMTMIMMSIKINVFNTISTDVFYSQRKKLKL